MHKTIQVREAELERAKKAQKLISQILELSYTAEGIGEKRYTMRDIEAGVGLPYMRVFMARQGTNVLTDKELDRLTEYAGRLGVKSE